MMSAREVHREALSCSTVEMSPSWAATARRHDPHSVHLQVNCHELVVERWTLAVPATQPPRCFPSGEALLCAAPRRDCQSAH